MNGAVKGAMMAHVQAPLRCFGDRRATNASSSLMVAEPVDFGCISGIYQGYGEEFKHEGETDSLETDIL